jgi:hypothetical protein
MIEDCRLRIVDFPRLGKGIHWNFQALETEPLQADREG